MKISWNKMMPRLCLSIMCIIFSALSMAMTFAPTDAPISYGGLTVGNTYDDMLKTFGKPRYEESDYLWGQKVTYYVYKNNNKIGIADDTNKIVDMQIVDDTYNHGKGFYMGTTAYKIEQTFGHTDRQLIDGKVCYVYKNESENNAKIILQVEASDKYLESLRITTLPIDIPEDKTAYVPDDATDESENPMIADKKIDTDSVKKPSGEFRIHYNYSITK